MTIYELFQYRVSRATQKVQKSHKLPKDVKCLIINIIRLKLAFRYGQQKPYERKSHLRNMQAQLKERMSWERT